MHPANEDSSVLRPPLLARPEHQAGRPSLAEPALAKPADASQSRSHKQSVRTTSMDEYKPILERCPSYKSATSARHTDTTELSSSRSADTPSPPYACEPEAAGGPADVGQIGQAAPADGGAMASASASLGHHSRMSCCSSARTSYPTTNRSSANHSSNTQVRRCGCLHVCMCVGVCNNVLIFVS